MIGIKIIKYILHSFNLDLFAEIVLDSTKKHLALKTKIPSLMTVI